MSWPAGVVLRTCSLGPDFGIVSGEDYGCDIVVSVSRPTMTWGATGSGGIGDTETLSFDPGQEVTFQLPVTDQEGWYIGGLPVDVSDGKQSHVYTLTIKPWVYGSLGRKTYSNATLTLSNLAVPTGDGTLDLDLSVATSGAQGGTVTVPDLVGQLEASVATYRDQAESYAQAAHDISNIDTTDDAVSVLVGDPSAGPKTSAALNAAYAAELAGYDTPARNVLVDAVALGVSNVSAPRASRAANQLFEAHTGSAGASLTTTSLNSTFVQFWSMSGSTSGQSVVGQFPSLGGYGQGVRVRVSLTTATGDTGGNREVFQAIISELEDGAGIDDNRWMGPCVIGKALATQKTQLRQLESFVPVDTAKPMMVRVLRINADAMDTWTGSTGIVGVEIESVTVPDPLTVQVADTYNSWPFLLSLGGNLVAVWSRAGSHNTDPIRAVRRSISTDGGKTWSASAIVIDTADTDDAVTGKGVDAEGNGLLWVRRGGGTGGATGHYLYRSIDNGLTWTLVSSPTLASDTIQCSDIFTVPGVGLMSFYHGGTYDAGTSNKSWGIVKSTDDGATWTQVAMETGLALVDWPTEISGQVVGSGQILAMGRSEDVYNDYTTTKAQFQIQSTDSGTTFTKARTNVTDVLTSTPSMIFDATAETVTIYYFDRSRGALKRRLSPLATVWDNPLDWPDSDVVAVGTVGSDAGNCNAVVHGGHHKVAYYTGDSANTAIVLANPLMVA